MRRSYRSTKAKKNAVYSVEGIMILYGVSANTVSEWVGAGLMPSDSQRPYVFQGAMVQNFHRERRKQTSYRLSTYEFACWTCQDSVNLLPDTCTIGTSKNGKRMAFAACPSCANRVQKFISETDCDKFLDCRNHGIPVESQHEEDSLIHGGIWINGENNTVQLWHLNDRIIFQWQGYAGRYSVKTVDRHLSAIRYCEDVLAGKSFAKLTASNIIKVREDLKRRANRHAVDYLSPSSIRHVVSHLVAFLGWLIKQDGFKRLPKDLPDYLQMPQAIFANAAPATIKQYPSMEEASKLLREMPSYSLVERRARAIFAIAFLGALRADTIISLRIEHIDIKRRLIVQDGSVVRTKAGKSLNISWFPIHPCFADVVIEWIDALKNLKYSDADALFPDARFLTFRPILPEPRKPIPVMTSSHVVANAFSIACGNSSIKYTPHCVKDTIAAERDKRPLTQEQRKAWSVNMGHETEQITETYYGKMTHEDRIGLMESIDDAVASSQNSMSDADKIALVDGVLNTINRK